MDVCRLLLILGLKIMFGSAYYAFMFVGSSSANCVTNPLSLLNRYRLGTKPLPNLICWYPEGTYNCVFP